MKEPPDKYRTVKCTLKSIVKKDRNIPKILDAVVRTHRLTIHVYQLLRLWMLDKYDDNELPTITTDIIKMAFKVLSLKSAGPKPKGNNLKILNELEELYEREYKHLGCLKKIDAVNLSQIIGYASVDMLKNIENNIKLNFTKYVNRFVNSMFRKDNNVILEQLKGKEKIAMSKKLNSELYIVKQDILKNTLNSVGIYREFVMKHRHNITPKTINEKYTIEVDIECNPQRYLRSMIYMCLEIEEVETKLFQFFPMRTDIIPKYCPIDTKSLIEIFIKENKSEYLGNIEDYKESIWNIYFNMNNAIFAQNNYVFDYRISTDGLSVSIQMINKKYVEKESIKKHNMKNKRNEIKEATKNMTPKEKEQYKQKLKDNKKQESDKIKASMKIKKEEQKQAFKKLSQSEKIKIIKRDCPYLEDLTKVQIEELKTNNWVVCDPGRNNLLYMKSKNGIVFRYSNRKHLKLTKRIKYMRMFKKYKDKNNITKIENELSKYNSKTCNWDNFKQYINAKNRINKLLFEKYENQIFRKYKWYSYLNRKKTETRLIREIKRTYGRKSTIVLGDWSMGKDGCKGSISTPNKGIKKLLTDNFNVYSIDEFRTSKLNYKTEEENDNLYLPDKKGIYREMHSILTFQMENKRMGCINRDNNAVSNMVKLVKYFIKTGKRLLKFRRDYKLKGDDQKDSEHNKSNVKHHHAHKGTIGALVTIK